MADPKMVEEYLRQFSGMSDAELIHRIHEYAPSTAQVIAATQLLDERRQRASEDRHLHTQATLESLKKPHWIVAWTFGFVVATFLVTVIMMIIAWLSWHQPVRPDANRPYGQSDGPSAVDTLVMPTQGKALPSPSSAQQPQAHTTAPASALVPPRPTLAPASTPATRQKP